MLLGCGLKMVMVGSFGNECLAVVMMMINNQPGSKFSIFAAVVHELVLSSTAEGEIGEDGGG